MSNTHKISKNTRAINTDVGCYVVSMDANFGDTDFTQDHKIDWEANPQIVQGHRVVPYGVNNNLPVELRNLLDDNNLAPGILEREKGLLFGQGPKLYTEDIVEGEFKRTWLKDDEIQKWLDTWNYMRFIDMAMTEYKHLKGIFVRWYRNKAPRIGGAGKITEIKVIPGTDARLGWPEKGAKRLEDVTKILTGDFENDCRETGIYNYPIFNKYDPFKYRVSMSYNNAYSFGRTFYSTPGFWGSRHWIQRNNDVVASIKYFQENAINAAFHIQSPAGYWEEKTANIVTDNPAWSEKQVANKIDEIKEEMFKKITEVLTGKKNAGKFIETVSFYDDQGNLQEWKVIPIEQHLKDFITAMIKIAEHGTSATTSGIGLHPSLSNIIVNGQLASGSQMLYALKLYLASDTTQAEQIIFETINDAIKINFPEKKVKMGFYRQIVMKEQEVTPKERTKENV